MIPGEVCRSLTESGGRTLGMICICENGLLGGYLRLGVVARRFETASAPVPRLMCFDLRPPPERA